MKIDPSKLPYFCLDTKRERILTFLLYGALPALSLALAISLAIFFCVSEHSPTDLASGRSADSASSDAAAGQSADSASSDAADSASSSGSGEETADAALAEQARFDTYRNTVFAVEVSSGTLSLHYNVANPAAYGIEESAVTWGSATRTELWDANLVTRNLLAKLSDYDFDLLTEEQQLCYRLLAAVADTLPESADAYLYDSVFSPTTGVQAQIPVLLAEYPFESKQDIEDYLTLIELLPDYFSSLLTLEEARIAFGILLPSVLAERVILQCQAIWQQAEDCFLIEVFNSKLLEYSDDVETLTEEEMNNYTERHDLLILNSYLPAYRLVATSLEALSSEDADPLGLYWYDGGAAYYEDFARSELGTSRSMEEYIELADEAIASDLGQIFLLLSADPSLSDAVMSLDDLFSDTTPEEILSDLSQAILADYPATGSAEDSPANSLFPIKYVNSALADTISPAFYLIPQIDSSRTNVIYLNASKLTESSSLYTTLAHEGFPGHLYQTSYFYASDPHPVRQLFACNGYVEGWATYAEISSYDYMGLSPALASLLKHNQAFTLGVYCRIDIGVNYEGWLEEDIIAYLEGFGLDGSSYAREIFYTMVEEPGNYLKYYLGFLELRGLAEKAEARGMSKIEFHEQVLTLGPLPFSLLEEYLGF